MGRGSDRELISLLSFVALIFGVLILLNNPINFESFPLNVTLNAWFGLFLLLGGALGVYYGFSK
jgi:hypothetical protein